jgi:hypothetical protein
MCVALIVYLALGLSFDTYLALGLSFYIMYEDKPRAK